jgi:hypothetical protein
VCVCVLSRSRSLSLSLSRSRLWPVCLPRARTFWTGGGTLPLDPWAPFFLAASSDSKTVCACIIDTRRKQFHVRPEAIRATNSMGISLVTVCWIVDRFSSVGDSFAHKIYTLSDHTTKHVLVFVVAHMTSEEKQENEHMLPKRVIVKMGQMPLIVLRGPSKIRVCEWVRPPDTKSTLKFFYHACGWSNPHETV